MQAAHTKYPYAGRFYVFNTSSDFETYAKANFGGNPTAKPPIPATPYPTSIAAGVFGFSYHDPSAPTTAPIYTAVFVKPTSTLTNKTIQKVTAHEAGHYLDWLYGAKLGKSVTKDVVSVKFDFQSLDYDSVGATAKASHLRPPCTTSTFDGKPGPLVGVLDASAKPSPIQFCNSGQIETIYRDPTNGGQPYRTSYILQQAWNYYLQANWNELYAQQFSWALYVNTVTNKSTYFSYVVDGVDSQGQFACTVKWATALQTKTANPPAGCSALKTWYPALLGQKSSHD